MNISKFIPNFVQKYNLKNYVTLGRVGSTQIMTQTWSKNTLGQIFKTQTRPNKSQTELGY